MPRGVVQEVEAVEEKPVAGVVMGMTGMSYLFLAAALAAVIAWIVYVAKSHDYLGYNQNTAGKDKPPGLYGDYTETATVCFQATVVAFLFYFATRHHFSNLHY